MQVTKPVLKWVGGKTQILDKVLGLFPTTMANYHEPFTGGGSVLLGLLSWKKAGKIQITGTIYASDLNANLIYLYKVIQQEPQNLIEEVKKLITEFNGITGTIVNRKATTLEEAKSSKESYYFWIRSKFNQTGQSVAKAAMLLFMNKTCFRGVYREGPNGFNVPYGNNKNPSIMDEAHIMEVSGLFQGVVFTVASYEASLASVSAGDFAYLDPPYAPETDTSFVSYTASGFTEEQHKALFALSRGLKEKRAKMLMSNADVPLVRDAFPPILYRTTSVTARRAINSKNPDAKTKEVLITSF